MVAVVLAIDAGTTGVRTVAVDPTGAAVGFAYRELPQHFPRPGWVEHDPDEIWRAVQDTLAEVVAGLGDGTVAAIGITDQRETVVVWDRATGRPRHRAIVWQDRRTAARCDDLRVAGVEPMVRARTGLVLDPYFSATKLEWLLRDGGVAADADLAFGTVDSWVLWNLTGVHATEPSNSSRTMLFDIDTGTWSDELLDLFGVPRSCLPEVRPSSGRFGITDPDRAAGLRVPVSGIAGDQQAALFGQACFSPGMTKNTYGTGSFVLVNLGDSHPPPVDGLLTTVAWQLGGAVTYAMEGSIFVTGAAVQWLRDGLGIIDASSEAGPVAASVPDTDGVVFVPAFTGLGSPYFDPYARGAVFGLTRGTTRAHLVARGGRGDGVADRRRHRGHHRCRRHPGHRAAGRRWRQRDGRALPVPGRRAGRHRAPTGQHRDDGARRRLARRHRRGRVGVAGRGRVGLARGRCVPARAPLPRPRTPGRVAPRRRPRPQLDRSRPHLIPRPTPSVLAWQTRGYRGSATPNRQVRGFSRAWGGRA